MEANNMKALRAALEFAKDELWANVNVASDSSKRVAAALAVPPRNCDRFATIDEARLEFQKIRGHKVWADIELWDDMDEVGAFARWIFASSETSKKETDNDKKD